MKKIILGLFVMLAVLVLGTKTLTLKAATTVTLTDGASIRLDDPAGLRFKATVSEPVEGAKYGIVFANGVVAKEDLVVDATGTVKNSVTELNSDNTYSVSMVGIPERAYFSSMTARAYVEINGEYTYSENVVTRNINEVARTWKQENTESSSDFITTVLSVAKLNTNGGTTKYESHEAMAADFLTDFNTYSGKTLASVSSLFGSTWTSDTSSNAFIKFFQNDDMFAKWSWTIKLFLSLGEQGYGKYDNDKENIHTEAIYNAILAKEFTSESIYTPILRQSFQSLFNLEKCAKGGIYAAIDFSLYEVSKQIEGAIDGGVELVNIDSLPIAYRNGYTFKGWYDQSGTQVTTLSEGQELTAQWEAETYTITYNLNGGTLPEDAATSYTIEGYTLPTPTNGSKQFMGWYDNADFNGDPISEIAGGSKGNVELYAKWVSASVSYVLNGGVMNDVDFLTSVLTEKASIKSTANSGYWANSGYASNIYLFAKANLTNAANAFKVEITEQSNGTYVVTKVHSGAGYTAGGTYILVISGSFAGNSNTSTDDVTTFKANVAVGQVVLFNGNLSTGVADVKFYDATEFSTAQTSDATLTVDTPYTLATKVSKTGYVFAGWYDNEEFTGDALTVIEETKTVYAKWVSLGEYTVVTYELNGGSYEYATREAMVADFLSDYNIFTSYGITNVADIYLSTERTKLTNFFKDEAMRAKWLWIFEEIKSLNSSIDSQYVDGVINGTSYSGYALQNVALYLLKMNYTTWYSTYCADGNTNYSLPSKYTCYDASGLDDNSFRPFISGAAKGALTETYYETAHTLPTTLYKEGYTFAGWYTSSDFSGDAVTSVSGNVTVYAKWEKAE